MKIFARFPHTNLYTLLLLMACISLLWGCEDFFVSEADNVDYPGSESQLVVYSYISPQDTLLRVYVYRSRPYMQNFDDYIPVDGDAEVYMAKKGGDYVLFQYDEEHQAFIMPATELTIQANQYYQLKVETYDGDFAKAECYVPGFDVEEIEVSDPVHLQDQWGNSYFDVEWKLTIHKKGEKKYFFTGAYNLAYEISNVAGRIDTIGPFYSDSYIEKGTPIFTDTEGNTYSFRLRQWDQYSYPGYPGNGGYTKVDSLFIYVLQTDFHYFRFHKSVEDYFYYGDDFPFAENVHIYTNIEGALGTFGGYNKELFLAN